MTTPGITPVGTTEAVAFCQNLLLPTQRNAALGNPDNWSDDVAAHTALVNVHGRANSAAEKLAKISRDLTVTSPVMHHNAYKVATDLTNVAEATQRALEGRAKEYFASSEDIMENRFKPNAAREGVYLRCVDWFAREAKNGEGNGYRNIREAITDDPDFALAMYNYSWRLMGLPQDHAFTFKEKVVEKFAPEALDYIERSHKLSQLAKKYPAFSATVHSSFYSIIELNKMQTRYGD